MLRLTQPDNKIRYLLILCDEFDNYNDYLTDRVQNLIESLLTIYMEKSAQPEFAI
jgi:hypothetical protein